MTAEADGPPAAELAVAVSHLLGAEVQVIGVNPLPIDAGVSGVAVRRLDVRLTAAGSTAVPIPPSVRVVIKPCPRPERVALSLVDGLASVPRVHVDDTGSDAVRDVVMLDAGERLLGFDDRAKQLAADALSDVHVRFLRRGDELEALPPLTEEYVRDFIVAGCWSRAWAGALGDQRFLAEFAASVEPVESSVRTLAADLLTFADELDLDTLAHTDVYHGHVYDDGRRALVIDWGQARRAPLFLDLGDTFDTPASMAIYRSTLAARGVRIRDDLFDRGHLLARRFAGIRYLWYWLESWRQQPEDWNDAGLARTLTLAAGRWHQAE